MELFSQNLSSLCNLIGSVKLIWRFTSVMWCVICPPVLCGCVFNNVLLPAFMIQFGILIRREYFLYKSLLVERCLLSIIIRSCNKSP
jgi:hypothetical protein